MKNRFRGKKWPWLLLDALLFLIFILADQGTKALARIRLKGRPPFVILRGVLEFSYLENRGAAFGILQGGQYIFVVGAILMLCAVLYCLLKFPATKRYLALHPLFVMLAAGGAGNMIDRLTHVFVIDFIYIRLINFPVFNVADIFVTVSTISLAILYLWKGKDADLAYLKPKKRRKAGDPDVG